MAEIDAVVMPRWCGRGHCRLHQRHCQTLPVAAVIWVRSFGGGDAEEVLLRGLIDWVALQRIHSHVARENSTEPLSVIQENVLDLIRSLVTDGLYVVGDLATEDHRFGAWDTPLEESLQRIREVYTKEFDDESAWWFICWLRLTEKGRQVAETIEANEQPG